MPNKYEDPDVMNSTTDKENSATKAVKKNSLAMASVYQAVDTSTITGCLAKAHSDEFPEGISHKAWILLHERFYKLDALSTSELREGV